jgi:hypothetical protein
MYMRLMSQHDGFSVCFGVFQSTAMCKHAHENQREQYVRRKCVNASHPVFMCNDDSSHAFCRYQHGSVIYTSVLILYNPVFSLTANSGYTSLTF